MNMKAMIGAALIGLLPSLAGAGVPASVASVADALRGLGFADVSISLRVLGGYVLQGRKGDDFVTVALGPDGRQLDRAQLYRDSDGNGVFAQDERLGPTLTQPVQAAVTAALSGSGTPTAADGEESLDIPGFSQQAERLFADQSLRASAHERLGSGLAVTEETLLSSDLDQTGMQHRGGQTRQVTTADGLSQRNQTAWIIQPGGPATDFAPLSFGADMPDADALRADAVAQSPDPVALRRSITGAAPDHDSLSTAITSTAPRADDLRSAILATVPTADAVRAGILPPQ